MTELYRYQHPAPKGNGFIFPTGLSVPDAELQQKWTDMSMTSEEKSGLSLPTIAPGAEQKWMVRKGERKSGPPQRKLVPGADHNLVWKTVAGPYSRGGIPDICAIIAGHFFGFEVKRPEVGRLSKIQEQTIKEINAAGGTAAVVSFPEQVQKIIMAAGIN